MLEYLRDGIEQESQPTIHTASKIKNNIFYFYYIISFNLLCHPILYCAFLIWEALQSASYSIMVAEKFGRHFEFNVLGTYAEKILVLPLLDDLLF